MSSHDEICIFLTVPHAAGCSEQSHYKSHPCDFWAQKMARKISKALIRGGFSNTFLYITDVPRSHVDMNRTKSRYMEYRVQLHDHIQQCLDDNKRVFVLDVHSFPSDHMPYGAADYTILDSIDPNTNNYSTDQDDYVRRFKAMALQSGFSIQIIKASNPAVDPAWKNKIKKYLNQKKIPINTIYTQGIEYSNDIMDVSRVQGARSFLLEVNEKLTSKELDQMAEFIVIYFKKI